ncbi:neutrophilic granule protein-like [Psammomys obesus]|uniref:neutrophilic granule protein-like n=1 Tax=Psammomys obesus TaxID=48139 RepID=UPI00245346A0|nr:neutrophilic granule protein-like [Psammomys obesus]
MAGQWKVLVLVVALAMLACEARRLLRYEDIVDLALKAYNKGQLGKPLFRLLNATPPSSQNPTASIPLEFRIKETVCTSTPERQPKNCDFLEDGEERNCTGEFFRKLKSTSLTLSCDRSCSREGVQMGSVAAYVSQEDKLKDLPPKIRDIYDNAKYDIINNILRNF